MKIEITLDSNGQLHVNGPLTNKIAMLGVLELAKNVVMDYNPTTQPLIQPATPADVSAVQGS